MKHGLWVMLVCCASVGCSAPAVITLKDGSRIETNNTPRMNHDGFYEYRESDGAEASVNGTEVLSIEEK